MTPRLDIAIVGAGAAGLATAIFAGTANPRLSIAVLEGEKKPGAKILVSGGSRCNVTNVSVSEHDFWGGRASIIRRVLRSLPVPETVAFFARIGVPLHEEADGKLFPDSNRARDVLNALLRESERGGARLLADHRVTDIVRSGEGFVVSTNQGPIHARRVVLATGGQSLPKSGSDGLGYQLAERLGHSVLPTTPALAPLVLDTRDPLHTRLSGVSHDAELTIWSGGRVAVRLTGLLLWTHFGVSGPVAMNASRHWARVETPRVTVNFRPGSRFDQVDAQLTAAITARPRVSMTTLLTTFVPGSVAEALLESAGFEDSGPAGQWNRERRRSLSHAVSEWELPVSATRGYNFAEATAGGVNLNEIDAATMASRRCPGLFLVGEVLDVDGRIGGFNFQWAWSSGHGAGSALART